MSADVCVGTMMQPLPSDTSSSRVNQRLRSHEHAQIQMTERGSVRYVGVRVLCIRTH